MPLPYPFLSCDLEAKREQVSSPRSAAGEAGSSSPLRLPLRRREGRGTPVLRPWCVQSRGRVSAGGAVEEEAWPERIKVLQLRPLCAGVLREAGVELAAFGAPRSSDLWRFRLPRVEGAVVSPFVFCGISVPPLRRHRAVVSSGGGFRSVGGCGGGVLLAVVVCCDLRLHPPLSGVCSVAGGSPGGFVQELVCGVGLRLHDALMNQQTSE